MNKKKNLIKFNMTQIMSSSLIEFNTLKQELITLKDNKNPDLNKIKSIELKLEELRRVFIKEFKKNNIEEISNYLNEKDLK